MKLGIALSGGGIRGYAHAGVLRALEENDIKIDMIGGTSSGSIVASFYSMGFSPYYIYIIAKRYAKEILGVNSTPIIPEIGNFIFNKKVKIKGLKDIEDLEQAINTIASKKGIKKISDITMPLIIPAVDISNSKKYIFASRLPKNTTQDESYITDISIGKAVRASSSFPIFFCPCKYKEHLFMDGGILDNIPAYEMKKYGVDKIISVKFDSDKITNQSNMMDIGMKILDIMGNKISQESLNISDYVLTIPSDGTGLLDVDKLDLCYSLGYNYTKQHIDEIKSALE